MYVVKVLHGYIGKDGRRTREKNTGQVVDF